MPNNKPTNLKNGNEAIRKHFKLGVELELFTLDQKGYMVSGGEKLLKTLEEKIPDLGVKPECGKNMIEIESLPETYIPNLMESVIEKLEKLVFAAKEAGFVIYPFGTYPGSFTPEISEGKRYKIQQELFGKQRFSIASRCIGLHCHYTLPWGVFDDSKKVLKPLVDSKHKQSLINIHNLFIAMDPALTTFCQSSPFYQGKFLGKDSRVIVYRGGSVFNYPQGLYSNYEDFGGLQRYITTSTDLRHEISKRFSEWDKLLEKFGLNVKTLFKHGSILDTTWNPVKINAHGTTEQRGMDANFPSIIVAVTMIIKYVSKQVQENFLQVVPSDIGIKNPFSQEGNNLYIPPDSYVLNHLQPKAAFEGLENEDVYNYCSALFKLAKAFIPEGRENLIRPLTEMLAERKTMSDRILDRAKEMGVDTKAGITDAKAADLALEFSEKLYQDLVLTKQALQQLSKNNEPNK